MQHNKFIIVTNILHKRKKNKVNKNKHSTSQYTFFFHFSELIYGRGLCENENKAYCEQWKAYCDQPAFFINENRYKMFVNKMCTAACNRCK